MLGVLLEALPKKRPLNKRREEKQSISEQKKKTRAERKASLKPARIECLSIHLMARLCWNGSMSCPTAGQVIITIIS